MRKACGPCLQHFGMIALEAQRLGFLLALYSMFTRAGVHYVDQQKPGNNTIIWPNAQCTQLLPERWMPLGARAPQKRSIQVYLSSEV